VNLVLDIGNTRIKAGVFDSSGLVQQFFFPRNAISEIKRLMHEFPQLKFAIISSVLSHSKEVSNLVGHKLNCIEFNYNTRIPIKNLYKTPDTLGNDRLAAAVGAHSKFKGKNILVIDAGTCIKYDFVNLNSEYLGGGISPGLEMRFKALNMFTERLPLVSKDEEFDGLIGASTRESLLSGVQNGLVQELKGVIKLYKMQFQDLKVVITGGDWQFFENGLKNSIFAAPFLVLEGLNEILNFNVGKKDK
jgi:type III pantothenate kinase